MNRPCLSCGRLIPSGRSYCVACQRANYRQRNEARPRFEVELYASAEWRRLARAVLEEAEFCYWCHTPAYVTKLTADHIATVREHPELATEPSNVVASCRSCQEKRKRRPDPRTWAAWERSPQR
jgi:5-methylcytosine-specific restriction endonuclease McrA